MPQPKRVRWECPNNLHPGVLGPTRPPLDSIVRYCLPCSFISGRLEKRIAPALQRKRESASATAAAKAKAQRARAAAKKAAAKQAEADRYTVEGVDLRVEMKRLLKLRAFGGKTGRLFRRPPELVVTRRSRPPQRLGYAEPWRNRISIVHYPRLTLANARETLIHELTHIVVGEQPGSANWHGPLFRKTLAAAVKEAYKVTATGIRVGRLHGGYAAGLARKEREERGE